MNLAVFISTKADATAFIYERLQLNVTRPDPIGYLCLSVSMPVNFHFGFRRFVHQRKHSVAIYLHKQRHQINRS